jgi:hypothetical protein
MPSKEIMHKTIELFRERGGYCALVKPWPLAVIRARSTPCAMQACWSNLGAASIGWPSFPLSQTLIS